MYPFITSSLLAAIFAASLVQAAPATERRATWGNLARDHATLRAFAKTITVDPQNIKQNWTAAGNDVCKFNGVACDQHPDGYRAVAGIDFNGFQFGQDLKLDGLLDQLVDLSFFHANSNGFVGTLPEVSKLKYLYEIDVSNNKLEGEFPVHVLDAPLTFLDLRFNGFHGPLPEALFTKTDLDVILLNNNKFSGPIPPTGNISTPYISLAGNHLTGEIPASLANNKGLKELQLIGNELTGNVPEELCALELDILDVSNNTGLTGQLGPKCKALFDKEILLINGTALSA